MSSLLQMAFDPPKRSRALLCVCLVHFTVLPAHVVVLLDALSSLRPGTVFTLFMSWYQLELKVAVVSIGKYKCGWVLKCNLCVVGSREDEAGQRLGSECEGSCEAP